MNQKSQLLNVKVNLKKFSDFSYKQFTIIKKLFNPSKSLSKPLLESTISQTEDINNIIQEENIINNFKAFNELEASDVMINRRDIVSASYNITFNHLMKLFVSEGHSRIPIYKSSLDDIEGFIHIKDVFKVSLNKFSSKVKPRELMRDIIFVPESIKLSELLTKMKLNQIHIAIVLDEHAGTAGLITIEDIVEELVGDINDEHDSNAQEDLIRQQDNYFYVDALAKIDIVEKIIGTKLIEDLDEVDYDTIGGFIITHLTCIPKIGYKFNFLKKLEFEILDSSPRRIKQIRIAII